MACEYHLGPCSSTVGSSGDPHSRSSDSLFFLIGASGQDKDSGGEQVEDGRGERGGFDRK